MKKLIFISAMQLLASIAICQSTDTVIIGGDTMIVFTADSPADKLFRQGDVYGAIDSFRAMFNGQEVHPTEIYNYACALSVTGQIDSAFKYLIISTSKNKTIFPLTDPDLLNLRKDKRWDDFETNLITAVQTRDSSIKDVEYAKRLWYMHATDQAYYKCITIAEEKTGRYSTVVLALWKLKEMLNEQNQNELEQLIELKGWPKKSEVGVEAASAAFLVIQHSTTEQQKKYLPFIKQRCEENEANWSSYALMYDRIQTHENKPQKYGSQVRFNAVTNMYELYPLLDESKVDEWRKEVGLGPLANYVSQWGIKLEPKKK